MIYSPRALSIAFQTDKTPSQYAELAQIVDGYGFDAVSVYCDAPFHPAYAALLLMAPHLKHARMGPAAVPPSRVHPIDIAAQTALLHQLAAGGVYIGLARGAWLEEVGVHEPAKPLLAIREALGVVRALLSGNAGGFAGEIYSLAPHIRAPYPVPDVPIPVLIGSWGQKLCALAGELADEVKVGGSANPDLIPVIQGYIAAGEQRAGREPGTVGVVMGAVCVVDDDREAAREAARRSVALYLPVVAPLDPTVQIEPELVERLKALANAADWSAAARLISDDVLDRFAFAGKPGDIIAQCERLFAAGASRIEFGTPHGLDSAWGIHLLGQVVVPGLRL
jgi:5,10-methylenetetrahydromethanopterin reductase